MSGALQNSTDLWTNIGTWIQNCLQKLSPFLFNSFSQTQNFWACRWAMGGSLWCSSPMFDWRLDVTQGHRCISPPQLLFMSLRRSWWGERRRHDSSYLFGFETTFINITHQSHSWTDSLWRMHIVLSVLDLTELSHSVCMCVCVGELGQNKNTQRSTLPGFVVHARWLRCVTASVEVKDQLLYFCFNISPSTFFFLLLHIDVWFRFLDDWMFW